MRKARKNFILGVLSECLWGLGFGLFMPATLVSLALVDLGGSAPLAGLLASIFATGITLPQAFSALALSPKWSDPPKTALLHLPAVLGPLLSGLGFVLIPSSDPSGRLVCLLAGFSVFSLAIGIAVPHWVAAIGRCLPENVRGRYFGLSFFASGLGSTLTGWWGAHWVSHGGLEWGYALCFLLAAPFLALSLLVLAFLKPITGRPLPPPPGAWKGSFKIMNQKLMEPGLFQTGLLLTFLLIITSSSGNLFTVYLKTQAHVETSWFEWFTPAMSLGATLGAFCLGWLVDHRGVRAGYAAAFVAGLASVSLILFWKSPGPPGLAYASFGFLNVSFPVINLVLILKLAGRRNSSIQTGLFNTLMSPWNFAAPLFAGWLAAHAGYGWAFGLAMVSCGVALGILAKNGTLDAKTGGKGRK